ncbi:hypothetical protein ACFXKR_04740 [Streptomyces violascens]|uniref:hypothetical protein n=1 Tax=Streptomyces violascens TaxID=67381 RepID=UPI0036D0C4CA
MKVQTITPIIASLALFISLATLWQSHLSRFKPVAVAGPLALRISKIESSGKTWYLPQVDCQVTITNAGARVGKVLGIRMVARYPLLPIPDAHEAFMSHSEVDPVIYRKNAKHRFSWIEEARMGDVTPFVLLARSSESKHVVFDKRWDDPVIQDKVEFTLEILTDRAQKWLSVERWSHRIDETTWSELVEVGTSMIVYPESSGSRDSFAIVPENLHEYTRGKRKIPSGGFNSPPSHLIAPRKSSSKGKKEQGKGERKQRE